MAQVITFTVRGIPAPQGSKRLMPLGGRRGGRLIMIESSRRVPKWRAAVRAAALGARDLLPADEQHRRTGAIAIRIEFRMPRPKGHYLPANARRAVPLLREDAPRRPIGKPDVDKLARAVLDALTGVAWVDDSQVVNVDASKVYANEHREVGAEVAVTDLTPFDEALAASAADAAERYGDRFVVVIPSLF